MFGRHYTIFNKKKILLCFGGNKLRHSLVDLGSAHNPSRAMPAEAESDMAGQRLPLCCLRRVQSHLAFLP